MGNRMSNIAAPMPPIRARFTSKLGIPLSGCKVYTYEPNSNTPKTTWIDIDKTVENTNPILLDAAGEADIFLDGLYQIVVKDRFGSVVYDVEKTGTHAEWDASFVVDGDKNQKQINALILDPESGVPTDKMIKTWSGRTQESKNKDYVTTKDYGAICDGHYHPLSEKFNTLLDAQAIYPFVTSLEQSIDDVALQHALNIAPAYQAVVVQGKHVSFSLNISSSDPVITNTVAYRKLRFDGWLLAGNDLKRFMTCDAPHCEITINCDGEGVGLNNILRVTQPYCKVINGVYKDIYSANFGAGAISFTGEGYGFTVSGNTVKNLTAAGNGSYGDGNGMCRAVAVDLTDPPEPSVIEKNYFDHITGEEGDIITVVSNSSGDGLSDAKVTIKNNRLGNANRRYIKVQGDGVSIRENYFFANDRSINFTPIRNCVDFVTGSNHEVIDNTFDSVIDFIQVSVYQSDSVTTQNNIKIRGNKFLGLKKSEHTKAILSLTSPGGSTFIIKDNLFTAGANAAIALSGMDKVVLKDNEFDVMDDASQPVVILTSSPSKVVAADNILASGNRQCFFSDSSIGAVYKDNINMTETPMFRAGNTNRRSILADNINFLSNLTTGSSYTGSYIYSNLRLDGLSNPYSAPMYITGSNPSQILGDAPVLKGQIIFSVDAISGNPVGYQAQSAGAANVVAWKGFGALL